MATTSLDATSLGAELKGLPRENLRDAVERIKSVINNPVRAEGIAQAESVNAYQTGLKTSL